MKTLFASLIGLPLVLIGGVIGLVIYLLFVALILAFCMWFFDKPHEWPYAIPIIISFFSLAITCGILDNFAKGLGTVVAFIVAALWIAFIVIDVKGDIQDIIGFFQGEMQTMDEMDMIMMYVDGVLNAKIFAVVSGIFAFGSSKE